MAKLLANGASLSIAPGEFVGVVKARNDTPLDLGQVEAKHCAQGKGLIKVSSPPAGEVEVLTSRAAPWSDAWSGLPTIRSRIPAGKRQRPIAPVADMP
jgi:hypothetical protein